MTLPRQTGAATASVLAEQATVTKSTQSIDSVSLTPHRIAAWTPYTIQLFKESSVDIEQFVRDDLMAILAVKFDQLAISGGGTTEPLGVLNSGVSAVDFGGVTATWDKLLEFESNISTLNADVANGKIGWVMSSDVKVRWKAVPKIAGFPTYLLESSLKFPDADGEAAGFPVFSSTLIPASRVILANWKDMLLAQWGGVDVTLDKYSSAQAGTVNVILNAFVDSAVRRAASFACSTGSGAL